MFRKQINNNIPDKSFSVNNNLTLCKEIGFDIETIKGANLLFGNNTKGKWLSQEISNLYCKNGPFKKIEEDHFRLGIIPTNNSDITKSGCKILDKIKTFLTKAINNNGPINISILSEYNPLSKPNQADIKNKYLNIHCNCFLIEFLDDDKTKKDSESWSIISNIFLITIKNRTKW